MNPLLSALLAAAAPAHATNVEVFAGAELLVRFTPRPEVGLGLEGTGTVLPGYLGPEIGAYADVRIFQLSGVETSAGGHAGLALAGFADGPGYVPIGLNLETGHVWTRRWGHGWRVGGELTAVVLELGLSAVLLQPERQDLADTWSSTTASFGLKLPLVPMYVAGRPLRVPGGCLLPSVRARPGLSPAARRWVRQAREELASVGSFLRLARELAALGGPDALVRAARRAADEERRHAALCLDRARRCSGQRLTLGPVPRATHRAPRLQTLADEAWLDGVLGEGAAAADAVVAAGAARDRGAEAVWREIARDEAAHAALGADIVDWCAGRGVVPRVCEATAPA